MFFYQWNGILAVTVIVIISSFVTMITTANYIVNHIFFHLFQMEALLADAIEDIEQPEEPSGEKEEEFEHITFGMMDYALQDHPVASSGSAASPSTADDLSTTSQVALSEPDTSMATAVSHRQDMCTIYFQHAERKLPESALPTLPVPESKYSERTAPETPVMLPSTQGNRMVENERSPKKTPKATTSIGISSKEKPPKEKSTKTTSVQETSDCEHEQVVPGLHHEFQASELPPSPRISKIRPPLWFSSDEESPERETANPDTDLLN